MLDDAVWCRPLGKEFACGGEGCIEGVVIYLN